MRTLHVAAQPFPSYQGTQALIDAMLRALARAGHETHLLSYAHGAFEDTPPYTHHRAPDWPRDRSLRAGPSLRKLALDAGLTWTLRRLVERVAPDVLVAHHVEAALACLAVRPSATLFVAHTDLAAELPTYLPPVLRRPSRAAGGRLDAALCRRARVALAVSPLLADALTASSGVRVDPLPAPWEPIAAAPPRDAARRALGLSPADEVLLYAGNLDHYQGWDVALGAVATLARERPRLRWLIGTEADPAALWEAASALGCGERLVLRPLAGERARQLLHAAADVALVPRHSPGGLPIKLLDAMARGVPAVATRRAAAGLPLEPGVRLVQDDDPQGLAQALREALDDPGAAAQRAAQARAYLAAQHAPARFTRALARAALDAGVQRGGLSP